MNKAKAAEPQLGYQPTKKESAACCLFFPGQSHLRGYAGCFETFPTGIGSAAK